jgi:hypothetical protein
MKNFEISKSYLFITYNWIDANTIDFIKRYNLSDVFGKSFELKGAIYGHTEALVNSHTFYRVDDLNEKLISVNGNEIEYKIYVHTTEEIRLTISNIYLFEFDNSDLSKIIDSINNNKFGSRIEKIINGVNQILVKSEELRNSFGIDDCTSMFYLETNRDIPDLKINNSVENIRNKISFNHSYLIPSKVVDCVIDNNSVFLNSKTSDNYMVFGLNSTTKSDEFYIYISLYAKSFLDYLLLVNKLYRFESELKKFDIYQLNISEYLDNAFQTKNLSNYFKNKYLKEKQNSSSKRIEYESELHSIQKRIKKSYEFNEFRNYNRGNDIIIFPEKASYPVMEKMVNEYEELTYRVGEIINLIKTKEDILNDAFRDLTTITTNELNLTLQKKMKYLTFLAIIITVIGIILSLKTEIRSFYDSHFNNSVLIEKNFEGNIENTGIVVDSLKNYENLNLKENDTIIIEEEKEELKR